MVWLTGGSLVLGLVMIVGLLGLIFWQGGRTFWPKPITQLELATGDTVFGQVTQTDTYRPSDETMAAWPQDVRDRLASTADDRPVEIGRRLLRTGNFEESGTNFDWVDTTLVTNESQPAWAVVVERQSTGRLYGVPVHYTVDGVVLESEPARIWERFSKVHADVRARFHTARSIEKEDLGRINRMQESARLDLRWIEGRESADPAAVAKAREDYARVVAEAKAEYDPLAARIDELRRVNSRYTMGFRLSDGSVVDLPIDDIVRAVQPNQLSFGEKLGVYASRWSEFLFDEPRKANSQGGVWPALFGTVVMTLIMTLLVVPFGVLAALYLHEYAKQGPLTSLVRIAVNNLAGVPSIVFGVFGLGFFCYIVGAGVDDLLFSKSLPQPTYGKGGILWASLTLALLTLPVVIVATEEALSAVPNSMREGSYACGATKWQTIWRIVLPRAQPGIMTGTILAIARGAGEVAPLMLVGAVKVAPDLPVDLGTFPYVFPDRSFMHLGFHIYDVGFQSQDSEAAKPMVYTTTLLLIGIVVSLNLMAIWIRARLRRRFRAAH
tara:strand:- start:3658 stop:5313 length:1656 start_codon:yes stop_codon:yes gene_type:complete